MANPSPEDLIRNQLDASNAAASKALEGFQKLAALNMQTARASLEESTEQINALLQARDAKTLTDLATSYAKLSPEKFAAYANAVYAISKETGTEIGAMVEKQIAETNAQIASAIESLARNAPGGGGAGAMEFITQSMNAARDAYDQMQANAQKFAAQAGMGAGAKKKT